MKLLMSTIAGGVTAGIVSMIYNARQSRKIRNRAMSLSRECSKANHPSTLYVNHTGVTPWNATVSDPFGTRTYKIESEGQ
jgi:hypothetical protein